MKNTSRFAVRLLSAALLINLACPAVKAAVQVLGVQYQEDIPYNEFDCIWNDKTYPTNCPPRALGCNVHIFFKNTGGGSITITDGTLAGYSLEDSLVLDEGVHNARSIYFNWDNPPQAILDAGEPVWYKGDPKTVAAGGVGKVVVRLRRPPVTSTVSLGAVTSGGTVTSNVTVDASAPILASIGYSTDRTKVYLHWRRSSGAAPSTIWLDGTNVTANTTTVGDSSMNFAASVINLSTALSEMSYHVYQGIYADGKMASAGQRAWTNKFIYATYGTFVLDANYTVADWIDEASDHGVNNCQVQVGDVVGYMNTGGGEAHCRARGFGYTSGDTTKFNQTDPPIDPDMFFLSDEPDAEEANMEGTFCGTGLKLPCGQSPMGILVMREIAAGESLRAIRPKTPTNVNLDGTYRPENYYAWGQAMDVTQVDPYYQRRLSDVYWRDQQRIPLYVQADYIYAVAKATVTGAEPNPANILLFSCEWKCPDEGSCDAQYVNDIWPFPTKEAKRIEIYYSLAAGAKGLGYWWLKPGYPSNGLADQGRPGAAALWKEMGLCGNEIRTVAPYLVTAHPVDVPLTTSTNVWAKALASRTDTMILIAVNDNYYNDESGCHYSNIPNATVTITLPTWMQPSPMAFEVSAGGLSAVSTSVNGSQLQVNLGTLSLTKMIVLTKNSLVPVEIQQRYNTGVRPGVCTFASEYCGNSAPTIVVPPQSQTVLVNSNALFTVAASGYPFPSYQWRFNGANISGATTNTYARTNAQVSHAGSYTVVASNSVGVVTSAVATLTVSTNGFPPSIVTSPQSQSVEVDSNATFTVTANGTAPLSYRWRFGGTTISGATNTSYTVSNAQLTNAGNYDVVVTNNAGSVTSAVATLTVTVPCVDPGLLNASFEGSNIGGVATNWTSYQRAPNPTSAWTIQTASPPSGAGAQYQQIANTSSTGGGGIRQNITGCTVGATYSVAGWFRGNSGNAVCTVKVSPTSSTSWATAVDLNPPQSVSGSTWTAFYGTVVASNATMTLWLDGQTTGTGLNKAECFDAIVLNCEQMPAGQPPTITQQPSAQNVCAGVNTSFTVTATGTGTLTYQWRTNGVNISNGSHYAGCTSTTLWVTNVSSADAVNYSVVVTDVNGSTTSANAALTLKTATSFSQQPSATNVCAGVNTTFSVAAVGDGTITYQWQTNGVNISNNSKYAGCTTATLWVTNAQSGDQVNYRCVATAGCGSATSFQAALGLLTATSITAQPVSQTACTGHDVQYSVTAAGSGTITYQWKTNGVNISNNSKYAGCTSSLLTISNVTSADVVNYTCAATATCGSATSSSATLTLKTPTLLNPSFELSNISGVATNWTGYQRSPNPTTVWTIQTASPPAGTGTNYQQIANTSSAGGGGVRQDIKNCVIGATYSIAGWYRGNSASATCTVKVSATASTSWATAISLSPVATYSGATWTNFSGTVVATGTNMTLWLDGQTTGTGLNKAECFDGITVTCTP